MGTTKIREMISRIIVDETGDAPGWVMITLMTAGIVVALSAVVGPALVSLFEKAIAIMSL